ARELHDIIAHYVSVMLLQAAGARRILTSEPDRAARALANIEHSGMQATEELRRLLGVIRADDPVKTDEEPSIQYGLDDLEPLLGRIQAAGVPVRLLIHGRPRDLDPSVDQSAYRIVQESLTNVTKYAGRGADTTVELRWEDDLVHLTVTDDGSGQLDRPPVQLSTGHGLVGLRERATAVGGQLHAGPLPGGGFQVTVTLPTPERHDAS
ncbi:MAG: sensor histidine kinase, partial [Actinomycetes bacterium]